MKRRCSRTIAIVAGAAAIGAVLRVATAPSAGELETQAVEAWRFGEVTQAEALARRALRASPLNRQAREVLHLVAAHDADVLLKVAITSSTPLDWPEAVASRFEAGNIAFEHGFAAVAERQWLDVLNLAQGHTGAYGRLLALAGLRMDASRLFELLKQRSASLPPSLETIRLMLTAESLDQETQNLRSILQGYVAQDANDVLSRVGLAKCLIVDGQPELALQLLKSAGTEDRGRLVRAHAHLLLGENEKAKAELPAELRRYSEAEFWFLQAHLADAEGRMEDACDLFSRAGELRPLSRHYRAGYCRLLRAAGDDRGNAKQAAVLQVIQQVELIAKNPSTVWDASQIENLLSLCQQADAGFAVEQLATYRNSLED